MTKGGKLVLTISLLTVLSLLSFAFSPEKASAQATDCSSFDDSYFCNKETNCIWRHTGFGLGYCDTISTPTSPPSTANCGSLTCSSNQTCIASGGSPYCLTKGTGGIGSFCYKLDDSPNHDACSSGYCDPATLKCADRSQPPTSAPPVTLRWQKIASCTAPTTGPLPTTPITVATVPPSKPTPTPSGCSGDTPYGCTNTTNNTTYCSNAPCPPSVPVPTTAVVAPTQAAPTPTRIPVTTGSANCPILGDGQCGKTDEKPEPNCSGLIYNEGVKITNCPKGLPVCWLCPEPTPTLIPTAVCNNTNTIENDCFKINGGFCAVGSSCKQDPNSTRKDCVCLSDTLPTPPPGIPTPTFSAPIPTPTFAPGSVLLDLNLTLEGLGANRKNLDASVTQQTLNIEVLNSLNNSVAFQTPPNSIDKIDYDQSTGQFRKTVSIGSLLAKGEYIVKVGIGKHLKKNTGVKTITGDKDGQRIPITATLFAGNANDADRIINALDFNTVVVCFGAKANNPASCTNKFAADIDYNGIVDIVDLNMVFRNYDKADE